MASKNTRNFVSGGFVAFVSGKRDYLIVAAVAASLGAGYSMLPEHPATAHRNITEAFLHTFPVDAQPRAYVPRQGVICLPPGLSDPRIGHAPECPGPTMAMR